MSFTVKKDSSGKKYLEVTTRGYDLIHEPLLNKGTSFTLDEIDSLKLRGIVAPHHTHLDEAVKKTLNVVNNKNSNLEKHIYLRGLQDRNETLFYALLCKYPVEMTPLVYTPHVGEACEKFSEIYRHARGVFIRYEDRDYLDDILSHSSFDDTEVIVVTDGERILGLGDQGAGGMGIPIGKLSLYTACAGIAPQKTLPILLDVGTNNEERLNDPLYIGSCHKRITGQEYDDFVELFIKAIKKRFPKVLLQFEDFGQQHALKLLNKYKDQLCTFNDDIQGTAAIVTGALLSATHAAELPIEKQNIVVVGAGSAGAGISRLIIKAMEYAGLSNSEALSRLFLVDRFGLLTDNLENLDFQQQFAKKVSNLSDWNIANKNNITLLETVTNAKATMILGVCAQGGIFSQAVIKQMAKNCNHPIVFPISNPNSKAEADPADVYKWTDNKAIVGTGSPFPDRVINGKPRRIDQVNNCYIFPGLGLGIVAVKANHISDHMFLTAAIELANISPAAKDKYANLLQPLTNIREISRTIAIAVAKEAVKSGFTEHQNLSDDEIEKLVDEATWTPEYLPYKFKG